MAIACRLTRELGNIPFGSDGIFGPGSLRSLYDLEPYKGVSLGGLSPS